MKEAFDLFDFEDEVPVMVLPTLEELQTPQKTPQPPIANIPHSNYRIAPDDSLTPTGAKHKIAANISVS
ncbi:MAG: hypothetical protein PHS41_09450 [Victivallaceae bacterium]|nr:hypothetical protein [Victivallaceae bacterium]